jgi:hypothetical protein
VEHRRVVIEPGGADYVSNAGILALSAAAARCRQSDGALALGPVPQPVRIVIGFAAMQDELSIAPSLEEAIGLVRKATDA